MIFESVPEKEEKKTTEMFWSNFASLSRQSSASWNLALFLASSGGRSRGRTRTTSGNGAKEAFTRPVK